MRHQCQRCDEHFDSSLEKPKRCGECGSPLWDTPRQRAKGAGRPPRELRKRKAKAKKKLAELTPVVASPDQRRTFGVDLATGPDETVEMPWDVPIPEIPSAIVEKELVRDLGRIASGVKEVAEVQAQMTPEPLSPIRVSRVRANKIKPERATTDADKQTLVKDPEAW